MLCCWCVLELRVGEYEGTELVLRLGGSKLTRFLGGLTVCGVGEESISEEEGQ